MEDKAENPKIQNIQEIQLDFGATTQIEEYQIEFSVDYWEADFGITTPLARGQ